MFSERRDSNDAQCHLALHSTYPTTTKRLWLYKVICKLSQQLSTSVSPGTVAGTYMEAPVLSGRLSSQYNVNASILVTTRRTIVVGYRSGFGKPTSGQFLSFDVGCESEKVDHRGSSGR